MNQRWKTGQSGCFNRKILNAVIAGISMTLTACGEQTSKPSAQLPSATSNQSDARFQPSTHFEDVNKNNLQDRAGTMIQLQETAQIAGLRVNHLSAAHGQFRLVETMGSGAGLIDFDADGYLDILICQGSEIPVDSDDTKPDNATQLYRNLRNGTFENVAEQAGVAFRGFAQGVAIGDYDGDGDDDIYISGFQTAALFENQGNGTFENVTEKSGVVTHGWATSCAFADLDSDGDLDLYVVRYLANTVDTTGRPTVTCNALPGQMGYCPPQAHQSERDSLYRNNGDGTFTDIGPEIGLSEKDGNGLGLAIADFDNDGNLDVFVANDKTPCRFYHNQGNMKFEESGLAWGLAYNESGEPTAAMGVAVGDFDNDGWLDLLVTNFYEEGATLFRNLGQGRFEVATTRTRLKIPTRSHLGFGTGFHDFDNDGNLDLFITNGHVNDVRPLRMPYQMTPQLFRNQGNGQFANVSDVAGDYFQQKWLGRGAAFGDFNNDGWVDVLVTHNEGPPALLMNQSKGMKPNHALRLFLKPSKINGKHVSPIGSQVRVKLKNGRTLTRTVLAGTSYLSAHDTRLCIGIGGETSADLEIRWPDGKVETFSGQKPDQLLVIEQSTE